MFEKIEKFLSQVLEIIDYRDDKQNFCTEFIENCVRVSLVRLMEVMSDEERLEFEDGLRVCKTDKEKEKILQKYYKDDFNEVFEETFKAMFVDFVEDIKESLNAKQKEKLKSYLVKLV